MKQIIIYHLPDKQIIFLVDGRRRTKKRRKRRRGAGERAAKRSEPARGCPPGVRVVGGRGTMLRVRGWLDGLGSWFPRRPGCDVRSPSGSTYRRPKARHPAHAVHSATPRFAPSTRPSGDAEDRRLMLSGRATEPGEPERTVFSPCRYRRATPSGDAKAYRYAPRVHCLLRASSSREDEGG